MAITTYTELQTAITRWLGGRTDLTTYYPDWITLFEAVANRRLRQSDQQTVTSGIVSTTGFISFPSDFLAIIEIKDSSGQNPPLEYRDEVWLDTAFPTFPSGTPQFYMMVAGGAAIYPANDSLTYNLIYYAEIPPLATNTSNWLLSAHPDLYLFGALTEAHTFLADMGQLQLAKARRDELFDEIDKLQFRRPAGITMASRGQTP